MVAPPMPLKWTRHPDFIALPCAGAGMVFRLALHVWETGCRPLPRSDHDLMAIARANRATWKVHVASIKSVIAAAIPELEHALHARRSRAHHLIEAQQASIAQRREARLARSNAPASLPLHAMDISPRKAPPKAPRPPNTAQTRLTD